MRRCEELRKTSIDDAQSAKLAVLKEYGKDIDSIAACLYQIQ